MIVNQSFLTQEKSNQTAKQQPQQQTSTAQLRINRMMIKRTIFNKSEIRKNLNWSTCDVIPGQNQHIN